MPSVLEHAMSYVAAGFSVIPARPDGSKAPAVDSWKEYQTRLPSPEELEAWFGSGLFGIAVICGAVSGNLEVLDFDELRSFLAWWDFLGGRNPRLLQSLPIIATPGDGRHVYYRLPNAPDGNQKIARRPPTQDELAVEPRIRNVTLVETRGEGGYVLAPGSPPTCHASGGLYQHIGGPAIELTPVLDGETL